MNIETCKLEEFSFRGKITRKIWIEWGEPVGSVAQFSEQILELYRNAKSQMDSDEEDQVGGESE